MVVLFENKNECCGCGACKHVCPQTAIEMKSDGEGFLYPFIHKNLCVDCGLCEKVCGFKNRTEKNGEPLGCYAAINKDKGVLEKSTSGGAFGALASYVLEQDGIVFGCHMDEEFNVGHIHISGINELWKIQGSKYVQSNLKNTFAEVEENLLKGRLVLYSGTPCQIDGLRHFLGKEHSRLITVDLICHGVPSNLFFKRYIQWFENKYSVKIINYKFRFKSKNMMECVGKIEYEKNGKIITKVLNFSEKYYFYYFFMTGKISRDCCYSCPYSNTSRPADFTIGDYWGVEDFHPEINTENGVSAVLVNTMS